LENEPEPEAEDRAEDQGFSITDNAILESFEMMIFSSIRQVAKMTFITPETMQTRFLESATEKIDRNAMIYLFLDLMLRQAQLILRFANFDRVRELVAEASSFCSIPPDTDDGPMCSAVIRILVLQIELADHDSSEEEAFRAFELAAGIPRTSLVLRQDAASCGCRGSSTSWTAGTNRPASSSGIRLSFSTEKDWRSGCMA
jgi:hypothetical protein